jgi:hypothetical protein
MTSTHGSWDADSGARAADSAECLLVVGGYSENSRDVEDVVTAARDRILMSPSAGDFFELRHVDMGPRPGPTAEGGAGVARLVFELTSRPGGVARNFSALLVIDQSVRAVDRVLRECRANSVLSELNVKLRGIARSDDRCGANDGLTSETGGRTVISPDGERLSEEDLDKEIERYAGDLLADFGSGGQQGLPASQLDELGAEAESQLRSVVEAAGTASLERRKAELREEAAQREAALTRKAERRRDEERERAKRRELKRDAKRQQAEATAAAGAEGAAEREAKGAAVPQDKKPSRAAERTQRRSARSVAARFSRAFGRSARGNTDGVDALAKDGTAEDVTRSDGAT